VATGLWHFHDWVWHDQNPGQNSGGAAFDEFRRQVLKDCPELGWLRDVTDATKHRGLGRLPEVAGAAPEWATTGGRLRLRLGIGPWRRLVFWLVLADGSKFDFLTAMRAGATYWQSQLPGRNLPNLPVVLSTPQPSQP
jgi:hypothetical protein